MKRATLDRLVPDRIEPKAWSASPLGLADILEQEFDTVHAESARKPPDPSQTSEQRLRELFASIHELPTTKRSALCLSGGGIRSATFALGIVQGLARRKLLSSFTYLSTVSGGGYLGGWLSAWAKHHPRGFAGVEEALGATAPSALAPDPEPVAHLRAYSNYLSPKLGLLSADTWTLAATVLRNLLLNWMILLPVIAAAAMLPSAWYEILTLYAGDAAGGPIQVVRSVALVLAIIAVGYAALDIPSLGDFRLPQRTYLWFSLYPLVIASYLLCTAWAWKNHASLPAAAPVRVVKFGVAAILLFGLPTLLFGIIKRRRATKLLTILLATAVSASLGGVGAWLLATRAFPYPDTNLKLYVCIAPGALLGVLALSAVLFVGLSSRATTDEDQEWWSRAGAWALIAIVYSTVTPAITLFGPQAISSIWHWVVPLGGVSGLLTALIGFGGSSSWKLEPQQPDGTPSSRWSKLLLALAAPTFAIVLVILLALGTDALANALAPRLAGEGGGLPGLDARVWAKLWTLAGLVSLSWIMGYFVNVNRFSLHATYRNRLIRAYLGASRVEGAVPLSLASSLKQRWLRRKEPNPVANLPRRPSAFTGFDADDNIAMKDLTHAGSPTPFHVINITLNLVRGRRLAWQQRKAESFTVSQLHSGSPWLGYRPSDQYGGGITLGTAMTISGAAASPNMGYHSSPVVTLLMTLFNARLGWWLGNPGRAPREEDVPPGATTWDKDGPGIAFRPLFSEAFGLTNDTNPYVYLSDGGHFENLGLYEMVLRRSRLIVVSDAGEDPGNQFTDLGNAIRKIRVDFGIPIDFRGTVTGGVTPSGKTYCSIADIKYSCVDGPGTDGVLIYLKPSVTGGEPADVRNYAAEHPAFPHESAADQWFDEAQFESYRTLGSHVISEICGQDCKSLPDFVRAAEAYAGLG